MVRDITWKDLFSLTRYRDQLSYLDNDLRLVYNPGLLSSGLLSIAAPSSGFYTAVESIDEESYPFIIGQFSLSGQSPSARLAFLAPKMLGSHPGFDRLLTYMISKAGEKGAIQLLAEVSKNQPEEEILYQAGFKPYADQQIWKLPRNLSYGIGKVAWVPVARRDQDQINSLYQRVLPSAVQRLEPPPSYPENQGMVSWREGRMVGFASTRFGPKGILVDLVLDPSLSNENDYLGALFFHLPYRNTRNVFLRIRSYQQRIASALELVGAVPGPEQSAVVKKMAVHYNAKQTFRVQGFEKQPDITTPISNTEIKN